MSDTPLSEEHGKYHGLVGKIKKIQEDETTSKYFRSAQKSADRVFDKYSKDDIVDFAKLDEADIEKDFGEIWDEFAVNIAKTYLNMTDDEIDLWRNKKTPSGANVWEHMMGRYVGITKQEYIDSLKAQGTVNAREKHDVIAHPLAQKHIQYSVGEMLDDNLKSLEDITGVNNYVKVVKEHNPNAMKKVSDKPYKSLGEAKQGLASTASYIPDNYDIDNPETYGA